LGKLSGVKWERGCKGRKWGENGERMEVPEMGMQEKIAPKTQQIWHFWTPLGGYNAVSYIVESSFPGQHFYRR